LSAPITPAGGPEPTPETEAASASAPARRTQPAQAADAEEPSVRVDTFPSSPPPEVAHEMAIADRAYEKLRASGRDISFQTDPQTGRTTIALLDQSGAATRTLSVEELLKAAVGEPID